MQDLVPVEQYDIVEKTKILYCALFLNALSSALAVTSDGQTVSVECNKSKYVLNRHGKAVERKNDFIVSLVLDGVQVTEFIPSCYWNMFVIPQVDYIDIIDYHDNEDVVERLEIFISKVVPIFK